MDARRSKQLIYGGLYLAILAGIAAGVYFSFFRVAPSCFDHAQNQGEAGVDCGGPCAAVCIPSTLQQISTVGSVNIFDAFPAMSSLPRHYTFLAGVANLNAGFAARSFGYRFDLYDASGTLLQSVPGNSFIYAGQTKYLVAANVAVNAIVDHATLAILSADWVPGQALGVVPQFPVQNLGQDPLSSSTILVNGAVTDQDVSSFLNILIVAIFYDAQNIPRGASQTMVDAIGPGETARFSVVYPETPGIDPSRTAFFAYGLRP